MKTAYRKFNQFTQLKLAYNISNDSLKVIRDGATMGDMVTIDLPQNTQVMVYYPDAYQQILVKQADKFAKDMQYTDENVGLAMFMGQGILTSNGDFWRKQRKLVQPAFHTQRISAYAEAMVEETQKAMTTWQDSTTIDVSAEMMRITLNIIARTLFGANVEDDFERIAHAMDALQEFAGNPPGFTPSWFPSLRRMRAKRAKAVLDEIIYRIIDARRAIMEDTGDLLSMLLLAQDDTGRGMTDTQVRDEAVTLFLAGHETTANTLNWTWMLLAQHPEIAHKLHTELDAVLAGRAPTLMDLRQLPYTEMVIKESMRLYPPAFAISRVALDDVEIVGETIAKGSVVNMFPFMVHRDPRYWGDPDTFKPERWQDEDVIQHRYAYIPFGAGQRVCVGSSFAMMEAQLLLASMASHWTMALKPGQTVTPEPLITLRPKDGLPMTLTRRTPVTIGQDVTTHQPALA